MNTQDALTIGAHWAQQASQAYAALARLADEAGFHGTAAHHRAQAADADAAAQAIDRAAFAARLIRVPKEPQP
jgi:ferritin